MNSLQVHGEVTNPDVDVFDREKVFIDTVLRPLIQKFPQLKVVMEHITTKDAVDFVLSSDESMPSCQMLLNAEVPLCLINQDDVIATV